MRRSVVCVLLVVAACGGESPVTSTAPPATAATTVATTVPETIPPTTPPDAGVLALLPAGDAMGPGWEEVLFVPYGVTEDTLGTAPGGEGGTLDLGPEYGAQAPDGTWWFLDAANARLARFGPDGSLVAAIPVPADILTQGVYLQFQLPRVLADGTFVAFGYRDETTAVLRASSHGAIDQVLLPGFVAPRTDDGVLVYGYDDGGAAVAIDPVGETVTPVEWFRTPTGARYRLGMTEGGLRIELPDAGVDRVLPLVTAADPAVRAFGSIEATATADGTIHLLVLGASEADETTQLAGYAAVLPDGTVTAMTAVRNPFTTADPGSPAHLGAAAGDATPWFMVVDTDGVRVYRRG